MLDHVQVSIPYHCSCPLGTGTDSRTDSFVVTRIKGSLVSASLGSGLSEVVINVNLVLNFAKILAPYPSSSPSNLIRTTHLNLPTLSSAERPTSSHNHPRSSFLPRQQGQQQRGGGALALRLIRDIDRFLHHRVHRVPVIAFLEPETSTLIDLWDALLRPYSSTACSLRSLSATDRDTELIRQSISRTYSCSRRLSLCLSRCRHLSWI